MVVVTAAIGALKHWYSTDNTICVALPWQGRAVVLISLLVTGLISYGTAADQTLIDKKVIEFGWDIPMASELPDRAAAMQALPFDGTVIDLLLDRQGTRDTDNRFSSNAFGKRGFPLERFQPDIEDLRTAELGRLTDNFLRLNVTPGEVDWFDDFSPILQNARVAATIARQGRMKGICFDAESYKGRLWCYPKQKYRDRKRFAQYAIQVRQRGSPFMRTLNSGYRDLTILLLPHTYWAVHAAATSRGPLETWPADVMEREAEEPVVLYGLLPAFVDGMLEAALPETVIVDAWERSYGYRFDGAYHAARKVMKQGYRDVTAVPDALNRHMRTGFGVWVDFGSQAGTEGWSPKNLQKNYFTPVEFEWAVHHALRHTDRHVWIYSQQLNWWRGCNIHPDYAQALRRARRERESHLQPIRSLTAKNNRVNFFANLSARQLPGWSDKETFGDLWDNHQELATLPLQWKFRTDPENVGRQEAWFDPNYDDSSWKMIPIAEWWERAGIDFDGLAWYRVWVEIPPLPAGTPAQLYFGAVDDSAWAYVNGQCVGKHDRGIAGWDQRFSVDASSAVQPGMNLIAVRVLDRGHGGGLWKSVKLVTKKR